ncbi:helix-turn-helix domain-containing protein, partial [Listeria booriae]
NQVYSWVQKYQALGEDALQDRRGRSKPKEELTEAEILTLRIKELEAQNERLEIENAIAKKLQEIEQKYQDFH